MRGKINNEKCRENERRDGAITASKILRKISLTYRIWEAIAALPNPWELRRSLKGSYPLIKSKNGMDIYKKAANRGKKLAIKNPDHRCKISSVSDFPQLPFGFNRKRGSA